MAAFANRAEAGRALALRLAAHAGASDMLVLGLPRGGVPVAYEVAVALDAPLDVFSVRRLASPGHADLAVGAVATGGVRVINDEVVRALELDDARIDALARSAGEELERIEALHRGDRPPLEVAGHLLILVDDGLATGFTMRSAVAALRALGAGRIVASAPIAPPETCAELTPQVDEMV